VPVVSLFLKLGGSLMPYPLSPAESLFVLQLMVHKWDAKAPFPSYRLVAKRMGVSVEYARSISRGLERKRYLNRILRIGKTVKFDLNPLFGVLAENARKHLTEKKQHEDDEM
jgi:hypothetical protein